MSHEKGLTYTNRLGTVYYLCATTTKTGKTRFVMASQPIGTPLQRLPEGHEIVESINGVISVRKCVPPLITEAERQAVQAVLTKDPALVGYRAEVIKDAVVVFEPRGGGGRDGDWGNLMSQMSKLLGVDTTSILSRTYARGPDSYQPMLRFLLRDAQARRFEAQRMCFRGGYEGWIEIINADAEGDVGTLRKLSSKSRQFRSGI